MLRWGLGLLGAVVLVAAVLLAGALWWTLPARHQVAEITGLSAPVEIGIDAEGVPRIHAANALDGAAALGFVHARDRMFQMELMRRAASGRLSELVGGSTLRLDETMRIMGLRRRAEADLAALDADTREMLEAYSRGVNAWIALRGRFAAPELLVLGTPEPWTSVDSLLWGKTMALYLSGNWRQELARAALLQSMPTARVKALWPGQDHTPSPDARLGPAATRLAAAVPAFPAPFTQPDTASNEWAVDAAHSTTGAPLLAGDPHLAYTFPGVWYLARIETPQGVLAGATAPGVPFMVLGHNGHIAWTFTTTGADTQDVFIETPLPGGMYATPDGPRAFVHHREVIHVRGGADVVLDVRDTRHGPVLSDLDGKTGPVLAVAMATLQPGDSAAAGLLALNRATTLEAGHQASALIADPVQNLLIASKDGIGMFTTGRVPVRRAGDGTLPVAGADGAHDWIGFARGDQLPHQVNPASGRLVNANERTVGPDFPVFMGADWFGDWRARRIRALLDTRTTQSVQAFQQMQVDAVSAFAQAMLPRLLKVTPANKESAAALRTLRRWDGWMSVERSQPLLFNEWMRRFSAAVLARDGIPPGLGGAPADVVARALTPGDEAWCGGDCDGMLSGTLADAARGFDVDARWGDLHAAVFAHPILNMIPVLSRLARWQIPQPGDATTIFQGGMAQPSWASVHGPSFRGIYNLADLDHSLFALAPGQSGNPLRRHAHDLLQRWAYGTTLQLGAEGAAVETVELRPAAAARAAVLGR